MYNFYTLLIIILLIVIYFYYNSYMEALKLIEKYENGDLDDSEKELKKFREEKEGGVYEMLSNNSQYISLLSRFV